MLKHMPFKWELISGSIDAQHSTWRAKVIGGWVIKSQFNDEDFGSSESMVFLPDRDLEWTIIEPKADPITQQSTLAKDFEC